MRCTLFLDGKPVPGQISYFSGDASFLNRWRAATSRNPKARDSTYFANCALKQWEAFHAAENYARSIDEIDTYIIDNPNVEVSNFVLLTMGEFDREPNTRDSNSEFAAGNVAGFCHFRRTWCNNIVVDFIAAHPKIADGSAMPAVRGVATALLVFISRLALQRKCDLIWGEATQNSHVFYERTFGLDNVRDSFSIPRDRFAAFLAKNTGVICE